MFRMFILIVFIMNSLACLALEKGFNQAWLKANYAYQWLDKYYDQKYAEDILILTTKSGSSLLRMWVYEGATLSQFEFNEKKQSIKLRPEVTKNLKHFFKLARKHNVKLNLTLLDGNAYKDLTFKPVLLNFWWNVFNNKYNMQNHFYQEAILPIYQMIKSDFMDVVTQIDLVNEVNALEYFNLFHQPKINLSRFLCQIGKSSPVPITASLGWAGAVEKMMQGYLADACLDFYDIHLYNDEGVIPLCAQFKRMARQGVRFQLGEFGQKSAAFDEKLQTLTTKNFIKNAKKCGFQSALAWRLDDTRDGFNPEARFSFLAFNKPREAYYIFKNID